MQISGKGLSKALSALFISAYAASFLSIALASPDSSSSQSSGSRVMNVTPAHACEIIKNDPDPVIIDVRTSQEYHKGRLDGAINLDYYSSGFSDRLKSLNKTRTCVIYCRKGIRGARACEIMKSLGFKEVYNIIGGLTLWSQQGRPMIGEVASPPAPATPPSSSPETSPERSSPPETPSSSPKSSLSSPEK